MVWMVFFLVIPSFRKHRIQVVLEGQSSTTYLLNAGVPQWSVINSWAYLFSYVHQWLTRWCSLKCYCICRWYIAYGHFFLAPTFFWVILSKFYKMSRKWVKHSHLIWNLIKYLDIGIWVGLDNLFPNLELKQSKCIIELFCSYLARIDELHIFLETTPS